MRIKKVLLLLLSVIFISFLFPVTVLANAAEPAAFTIIITNPPENLELSLQLEDGTQTNILQLRSERKGWETYYRYFYHQSERHRDIDGATLMVKSSDGSFEMPLPEEAIVGYNNLLTLNIKEKTLSLGEAPLRTPLLVALRVGLTLLIEGIVFFLFGYRQKQSWLIFLLVNLVTQGALNASLTGPNVGYWQLGLIFFEPVIFIVEAVSFRGLLLEASKKKAVFYALTANICSWIVGGMYIANLPI